MITMLTSIRKFFSAPVFPDDDNKNRRARLLHVILVAQTFVLLFVLAGSLMTAITSGSEIGFELLVMAGGLVTILVWRFMMWRGMVSLPSIGMLFFFLASVSMILLSGGTIRSAGVIYYPAIVVMATLLVSRRAGIVFFVITSLVAVALVLGEMNGMLPAPENSTSGASAVIIVTGMGLTLVLLFLASRGTDEALARAASKEQEVRELASTLEKRVEERTRALAASAEVSRRLSTILDPNQLVFEVVEQIKSAFDYYHAHIYLYDEGKNELLMAGGTGEVGQILLSRGHKIAHGKGLVGRAAESNTMLLITDTTQDPDWLPNPLLPDTKSEVAVPISVGQDVIGVLDVQQNAIGGLSGEDAALLQSISYQVAVALRNARAYTATQVQAEKESIINDLGRKIQNTASIERALQVTIRELGQALGARDARIVLHLPEIMKKADR